MSGARDDSFERGRFQTGSDTGSPLEKVGQLADDLKKEAAGVVQDVSRQVKDQASNLKGSARDALSGATDKLRTVAEDQKNAGADFVTGIAAAVRRAASEFDSKIPQAGDYIRRAADQIDNTSDAVRQRNLAELVEGVQDFARRQPTAFLGATVLAGFVAIRFLKSSGASGAARQASQYRNENERRLAGAASHLPQGQGM
jgi:gas vesicle protein